MRTAPRRTRLIWVTALTVASLLLASGAMSAMAEGRGGPHGGGDDKHQPAVTSSVQHDDQDRGDATSTRSTTTTAASTNTSDQASGDVDRKHGDDNEDLVTPPAQVTEEQRPGLGCGDADDHSGAPGNPANTCQHPHDNDNGDMSGATGGGDDGSSAATGDDNSSEGGD